MTFPRILRRLHRWGFSRHKLRGSFLHSRLGDRILDRQLWIPTRESFARAWLVGMPITWVPFLPLQSVIACVAGYFVRANLPMCFALQYLSSPATAVIQLPACYIVGSWILRRDVSDTWFQFKAHPASALSVETFSIMLLGSILLGVLSGLVGYFLTHAVWRERPRRIRGAPPTPPTVV